MLRRRIWFLDDDDADGGASDNDEEGDDDSDDENDTSHNPRGDSRGEGSSNNVRPRLHAANIPPSPADAEAAFFL